MCGGSAPKVEAAPPPPPPAPPPVPVAELDLESVDKKNKRQMQTTKRRGTSAARRDLMINTGGTTPKAGMNIGGGKPS